jgi:hypothetical protein
MDVMEQVELPRDEGDESPYISYNYNTIFHAPYESPNLTPTNAQAKLPTLLTFL